MELDKSGIEFFYLRFSEAILYIDYPNLTMAAERIDSHDKI